jgi:hypothetical protein
MRALFLLPELTLVATLGRKASAMHPAEPQRA